MNTQPQQPQSWRTKRSRLNLQARVTQSQTSEHQVLPIPKSRMIGGSSQLVHWKNPVLRGHSVRFRIPIRSLCELAPKWRQGLDWNLCNKCNTRSWTQPTRRYGLILSQPKALPNSQNLHGGYRQTSWMQNNENSNWNCMVLGGQDHAALLRQPNSITFQPVHKGLPSGRCSKC